jgi:mRNA-degrading endonuclease toxin of MazEF toxin-antitoxin module
MKGLVPVKTIKPMEIWLISHTDPTGHEQTGIHPAIVVAVHKETNLSTVVPLTSQTDATRFPYTQQIQSSNQNGLDRDSVAMIFQTTCADFCRFTRRLGILEQTHFDRIAILLKHYLKL